MPNSTVTVREVKNKEAGLDLFIPAHKETPGLFQTVVEFHVVCVSKLSCFKTPKHKETDTVQFMLSKKVEDFEKLRKNLNTTLPGMVLPEIPKSVFGITITDSSILERRNTLDHFVKFIATVPKLAICHHTLEFLGVNPITAGKFSSGQPQSAAGPTFPKVTESSKDIFEEARESSLPEKSSSSLFGLTEGSGSGTDDEGDLFKPAKSKGDGAMAFSDNTPPETSTRLFASPDLGEYIQEDEEDLFLVPGAKEYKDKVKIEVEDNSEILKFEEDLDKLLQLDGNSKKSEQKNTEASRPKVATKPVVKEKPATKTKSLFEDEDLDEKTLNPTSCKPALPPKPGNKPRLAPKPTASTKPTVPISSGDIGVKSQGYGNLFDDNPHDVMSENLDADDILKYIQTNAPAADDDLELFS